MTTISPQHGPRHDDRLLSREMPAFMPIFARLLCVLLPIRALSPILPSVLSVGVLIAALLLPVIIGAIWRDRRTRFIFVLVVLATACAPLLLQWTLRDHGLDEAVAITLFVALAAFLIFIGAVRWLSAYVSPTTITCYLAVGFFVQTALTPQVWQAQPWKYGFAFSVSIFALALAARVRARVLSYAVLLSIIVVSGLNDYRTYAGIAIATIAVMVASGIVFPKLRTTAHKIFGVAAIALVGYAAYRIVEWLSLAGALGTRNMLVTQAQLAEGGSLLAGGRVETPISVDLFTSRPMGYGPGVKPNYQDFRLGYDALSGRADDNLDSYLERFLFADQIKLHSIVADLWANFGIPGLALAGVLVVILGVAIVRTLSFTATPAFVIFASLTGLWNLGFSPIGSNFWELAAAVSIAIVYFSSGSRRDGQSDKFARSNSSRQLSINQTYR